MPRASVRWIGLSLFVIFSFTLFTSWFSPDTISSAQQVAADWSDKFQDNAVAGGINDKLMSNVPVVYQKVKSWWTSFFPDTNELRGLNVNPDEENPRCKVYTYYDRTHKSEDVEAVLQVWLKAWWAMGLYPVILTEENSKANPKYARLHQLYDGVLQPYIIDALLAMNAAKGQGLLAAHYVFPMTTIEDATLQDIRKCQPIDVLTRYEDSQDDILRGSKVAYENVIQALIGNEAAISKERVDKAGLEAISGVSLRELPACKTFARYNPATVTRLYPGLFEGKPVGQAGKSFSFTKNHLASLVNGHLQNNFLVNYRGGIEALSPKLPGIADYLHRRSVRIAMELTRCNLTPLPKTCAPQHKSSTTKCFDCSQLISSAIVKNVEGYIPKNNTMFIGTVPHPYTMLALQKGTLSLDGATVRASVRDIWSKKALTPALPAKSGALIGVIFLSDSLWKNEDMHLPDSHIWQTFEQDPVSLEYDVGFTLPELSKSLDQLAQTSEEKGIKFQDLVTETKRLVTAEQDRSAAVEMVESWSQYDAGAHQLITNHLDYKRYWLTLMLNENNGAFSKNIMI